MLGKRVLLAIILVMLLGLSACSTDSGSNRQAATASAGARYEYAVEYFVWRGSSETAVVRSIQDAINELADDGWELVDLVWEAPNQGVIAAFRRPR